MLDQIIVGGATSLANLIIHAVLLAAVVRTVRRLSVRDSVVPAFLQYTVVIVATGTLLVAGHFSEVVHSQTMVGNTFHDLGPELDGGACAGPAKAHLAILLLRP